MEYSTGGRQKPAPLRAPNAAKGFRSLESLGQKQAPMVVLGSQGKQLSTGLCIWRPGLAQRQQASVIEQRRWSAVRCGVIQMPLPQFRIFGGRECDGHGTI